MPGTTPGGYPYAEPTDPLVQWPATSLQLAQRLDTLAAAEPKVYYVQADCDEFGNALVDLSPADFSTNPTVLATITGVPSDTAQWVTVDAISTTSCAIRVRGATPLSRVVSVVAIGR